MSNTAIFAGGCFWCMEPPFSNQKGVTKVLPGYSGGQEKNPNYYDQKDHRESIEVTYDPNQVSFEELLDIYWKNIDPTDSGGQFADRGHHYKTAIFYRTDEEKKMAEESKKALEKSGKFNSPIVTEILPFTEFSPAEEEHRQYYKKNPTHYENYKEGSGRAGFLRNTWK